MYPNYISSEAALASENVYFSEHHAKKEGFELSMHPFSRNAVASFDWGGVILNDRMSKDNISRHRRYTSRLFELATAITNQSSINCVAITPNIIDNLNQTEKHFLKRIPTSWSETRFIDGYPTKFVVIARKENSSGKWYIAGINGTDKPIKTTISLPMIAGEKAQYYYENSDRSTAMRELKISRHGTMKVTLPVMGGFIIAQ